MVDNLHHFAENWSEDETHHNHETDTPNTTHDALPHIKEMNFYLSLFSFLRLIMIAVYLYMEYKEFPLEDYMKTNWMNWP